MVPVLSVGNTTMFRIAHLPALLLTLCGSAPACAQGFIIHCDTLQNGRAGSGLSVREVPEGYLVFCRQYAQTPPARRHIFIRKIDHAGEFLHETEYGDHPTAEYEIGAIDPVTRDQAGLHVSAFHEGWNYGDSVYLARYDDNGEMVDKHFVYAYPAEDSIFAVIRQVRPTSDGGFIMGGFFSRPGQIVAQAFLVRLVEAGDTLWSARFGPATMEQAHECTGETEYADGGFLVVGYRLGGPLDRGFLIRTDATGQQLWRRNFGYYSGTTNAVRTTADGGILTWSRYNNESGPGIPNTVGKMMLTKWDADGDILWQTMHNRSSATFTQDMEVLEDGSIITTGELGMYAVLGKYNSAGDSLWGRRYHILGNRNVLYDVEPTSDGGFIATGMGTRYAPVDTGFVTNQVIWVLKTDSLGCVEPGCHTVGVQEYLMDLQEHLRVWPNPVGPGQPITLAFTPPPAFVADGALRVVVLDAAGRVVFEQPFTEPVSVRTLQVPQLSAGRYHLHLTDDTRWLAGAGVVVE